MSYKTPTIAILGDNDATTIDVGIAVLYPALMYMMYEHDIVVY